MNALKTLWLFMLTVFTATCLVSCAVISKPVRKEAISPLPFKTLLLAADKHIGDTVILGGYILQTKNSLKESTLLILQSPLGLGQEPKSKDHTEGRFIVVHKGFLDPEVYRKDRKITLAGVVIGSVIMKTDGFPQPHLKIRSREIYLWPETPYPPHFQYVDPWYCPDFDSCYWYRHHPYFW